MTDDRRGSRVETTVLWLVAMGLAASMVLPGCARRTVASGEQELDVLLSRVENESMRDMWRTAYAEGRLPDLERLPEVPQDQWVTTRRRAAVSDMVTSGDQTPHRPVIRESTSADVRFFAPAPISGYEGPFGTIEVGPGRIVGKARGQNEPWEIIYKLPAPATLMKLSAGADLDLTFRKSITSGSIRQQIHLKSAEGKTILFYLATGAGMPVDQAIAGMPFTIRQKDPDEDGVSPVAVTLFGQEATLKPGDTMRVRTDQGEVELYLMISFYTRKPAAHLEEGDPYHVILLIYSPGS